MEKKEKSPLEMLADEEKIVETASVPNEEKSDKYATQRRKVTFFALLSAFLIVFSVFTAFLVRSEGKKEKNKNEETKFNDFSELARGRVVGDIKSAMNAKHKKIFETEAEEKRSETSAKAAVHKKMNKNEEKDREILEAYAKMSDAAASGGTQTGRKRRFVPGGESSGGGVFVKGKKNDAKKENLFALHDVKVKVKLDFSIRSTAQSTVVATVLEEIGEIPKGAKFYGSAKSFVNKRTQLAFSKLIIGSDEFSVKGFAVSGKDPGIESEVTDIADENIKSEVKQGITKTAGTILTGLAGSVGSTAGTTAANTVNPTTAEIAKQEEANKMRQEYRVPAGTSFFVYLE
ncbi:hypothetical protein J5681_06770 [bacterium]|nr:hypothetical protein [bacterium]